MGDLKGCGSEKIELIFIIRIYKVHSIQIECLYLVGLSKEQKLCTYPPTKAPITCWDNDK